MHGFDVGKEGLRAMKHDCFEKSNQNNCKTIYSNGSGFFPTYAISSVKPVDCMFFNYL